MRRKLNEDTMTENYMVRITKDYLVFSAAHFITYAGDICERLHGHNYRVQVEVGGPLDENQYVIDFIVLRDILKQIVDQLDHHVLLPTSHPQIKVTPDQQEVEAVFEDRRWLFPRCDVVLLPVANTTTELLARHIGLRLLADLAEAGQSKPARLRIGVDENFGQWGFWQWNSDGLPASKTI
jgi:6-pyruvoyltetrahydropterin/6-carboxytetrahydropterin synthase